MTVYEIVTQRMIESLEKGVVPWKKTWTGQALGGCRSLVSQKPYRGVNAFLTAVQGYRSPYWLTFNQARELGASVKKGARGTPITFFKELESTRSDGKLDRHAMIRFFTVFNVAQVEGLKLADKFLYPEPTTRTVPAIEAAEKVYMEMPNRPSLMHCGEQAYYSVGTDCVVMPERDSFESSEHYYATFMHELTHSTGSVKRLDRGLGLNPQPFGSPDYSREELVAEMGAAFLMASIGLDEPVRANQAAYLQSWIKVLKGDSRLIVQAASKAQAAAEYIQNVKRQELEKVA